jgi:hypothetical protein
MATPAPSEPVYRLPMAPLAVSVRKQALGIAGEARGHRTEVITPSSGTLGSFCWMKALMRGSGHCRR